ncbi:hypothetical protein MMC07_008899 [Pseudocyphellaria aurata]|nr:hypothetical protein [Pseudocyphellaria aurata]
MGSLIELGLVQDRIDELLRTDSLQNATTRAGLYFAVFEFFDRLGKHSDTAYLICEERFVKKQSGGLFVISTSRDFKGKGKPRAAHHLTSSSIGEIPPCTSASGQWREVGDMVRPSKGFHQEAPHDLNPILVLSP